MSPLNMQVAATIGMLDRCLSELKEHALNQQLDAGDAQTIKHHAEDCVGLGERVLGILKDRGKPSKVVGWYDHFNDCVYTSEQEAMAAAHGGNKITPLRA